MLVIEKAKAEDFSAISSLDLSIAEYSHNSIYLVDSTQAWRTWIDYDFTFKAVDHNNEIIGIVVAFPVRNKGWCIHKVLVSNEYLQENVALRLLEKLLKEVDKREAKSYVVVHPQDLYALKLYRLLGFNKRTFHQDYLGEDEGRFILSRPTNWPDAKKSKTKKIRPKVSNMWNIPIIMESSTGHDLERIDFHDDQVEKLQ